MNLFFNKKNALPIALLFACMGAGLFAFAQPATMTIPVGVGRNCGGSAITDSVKYFNYNANTNVLSHRSNCKPSLSPQSFAAGSAAISFNPYDGFLYYTRIVNMGGGIYNSYVWKWLPTTCPSGPPALDTVKMFPNKFVAGAEFDPATGLAYQINLVGPSGGPYDMEMQQVNYSTGVLGTSVPINFGGRKIYRGAGDVVLTPAGQFLGIFDNKYFAVNWQNYGIGPLTATFIDSLTFGANNYMVGLSFSGGKLVGSIRNSSSATPCSYNEIDILTGGQSPITQTSGAFSSYDMTNIGTGIGAAKELVSAVENPAGSGTYDIQYDIILQNYGGTPVSNIMATDTLTKINGVANLISASTSIISAPPGFTSNAAFNGAGNYGLIMPGSTLSNRPGQNRVVIRINCRVSGIVAGIVYNNQAYVTATNIFGDALRDSSTNGRIPDLNSNSRPDDAGESQPTPLLISVVAQTPPCASLARVMYTQTFGAGAGIVTGAGAIPAATTGSGAVLPTGITYYPAAGAIPIPTDTYAVSDSAQRGNLPEFTRLRDHTGNANGRMLLVNADAANTIMYSGSFRASLCPGQQYSLSFYSAFVGNGNYKTICDAFGGFQFPKIKMRLRDGVTGLIITEASTAIISDTTWRQFGLKFVSPTAFTYIIFELINDAPGGCGNDIALDDIQFGGCDPLPSVIADAADGCLGMSTTLSSTLSDAGVLPSVQYQWAVGSSSTGPFTAIAGATSATLTISPVGGADVGKYYVLYVSAPGNMLNPLCRYQSPAVLLNSKDSSRPATSASRDINNICPGKSVILTLNGGTLGTNASWKWYAGSCSGTAVGTGPSISVTPTSTTTYYVRAEGDCNNTVCQAVTVTVNCDIDDDDDGIPDYVESYIPIATQDANGNGIDNANDVTFPGYTDRNNDFINDYFQADGDVDNDGTPNYLDSGFPGRVDTNGDGVDDRFDFDMDGVPNSLDLDCDNDGIPDVVEAGGVDANGDGKIDNYTDTDTDGFSQNADANNTGSYTSGVGLGLLDLDADGKPNAIDRDSDNDGIPDVVEVYGTDANNDAVIDGFTDANADGLHDSYINATGLLRTGPDGDNNGRADNYPNKNMDNDGRANPYDLDTDGDGIVDAVEAGFADANFDGFADGVVGTDGWNTAVNAMPALNLTNTDAATDAGGAKPNWRDIDSDNDGIPDNVEGLSTAGYRLPAFADTDNDGIDDSYDGAPFAATFGGSGIIPYDKDIDGIPDYRDLDTDADGALDIYEGHDYNFNGIADDNIVPTGVDTDNDGLDNFFDLINGGSLNYKGTSAYMGNGGTLTGDASPGSSATVQKRVPAQPDRDWRYTFYVLPVQFVKFNANLQNEVVQLNWSIITSKELQSFEIERSFDNRSFRKITTVAATGITLNQEKTFNSADDILNIYKDVFFYRLKVITKNGEIQYSDVQMIRRTKIATAVSVHPNPANELVNVVFTAEKESTGTFRLIDNLGKVVLLQNQKISKGTNKVVLSGLSKFSSGAYTLQVQFSDRIETFKLLLNTRN